MRTLATLTISFVLAACGEEAAPPKPPDGPPPDTSGIDAMNGFRALMGVDPVTSNKQLFTAAQAHADYYLQHNGVDENCAGPKISPHNEVPGCDGFTGAAPWDRTGAAGYNGIVGECISFVNDGPQAMYGWLATVYHRLCIAAPEVFEIGYAKGINTTTGSKVDVLEVGHASVTDLAKIARWPVPDAQDVPKSWDGLESPLPPTPPNGYPSGPIISVSYSPNDDVVINNATLSDQVGDVPSYVLTPSNDPNLDGSSSYFIYAHEPLIERRNYTVRFSGTRSGGFWNDEWSFFVPCDRSNPSDGKACDGNSLLACNINDPIQEDCGAATCIEWARGAMCVDGPLVSCVEPDNTFLRCEGAEQIYCIGGYEVANVDCGIDLCHEGPAGPVCASDPVTTCTTTDTYCEDNYVILCEDGFMRHRDCGDESLFCQVNSDGTRGYCAAMRAPCASENGGRCAGQVPVSCIDNWEIPSEMCSGTCVEDGQNAYCE